MPSQTFLPESSPVTIQDWPHSPIHRVSRLGVYMVTAGTYLKQPIFTDADALTKLTNLLLELADIYRWNMQAWAVFPNHYHFLGAPERPANLKHFIRAFHSESATHINRSHGTRGRKVWFQYWDTLITFQPSYLARLNYVHQNPVRHRVVRIASDYPWCSMGWFERLADREFYRTVSSFPTTRLSIPDNFEVILTP